MTPKLALLDRDGTLIKHVHYLADPDGVELLPGTVSGLQILKEKGYLLVMVSNQSGIGRGYFGADAVAAVNARLQQLLKSHQIPLDLLLFCPHAPEQSCTCRKPSIGLAQQAMQILGVGLQDALVVGDSDCDMQLAQNLGIPGYRLGSTELPNLGHLARLLD